MKSAPLSLPAKFAPRAEFFDVEGVPVSFNAGAGPSLCVAWEPPSPRPFPSDSMRRNGNPIGEAEFRTLVVSVRENA